MKEFKGNTGVRIVINEGNFQTVKKLRKCLAEELQKVHIDIGNPKSLEEIKNSFNGDVSKWLNIIKDCILGLECSENFERVMQDLLNNCTWNDIRISDELFDDKIEAREDYDRIRFEVIKINLLPFFKKVFGNVKQE